MQPSQLMICDFLSGYRAPMSNLILHFFTPTSVPLRWIIPGSGSIRPLPTRRVGDLPVTWKVLSGYTQLKPHQP